MAPVSVAEKWQRYRVGRDADPEPRQHYKKKERNRWIKDTDKEKNKVSV